MFERSRRIDLDDGRPLVVQWQGDAYGWGAYIPGDNKRPTSAPSPAEAIATHLDIRPQTPAWVEQLSERLERELANAPRYKCDCCGYKKLLNPGHYDICPACRWEDDRSDNNRCRGGPDAPSGPNRISLSAARRNFARFQASTERARGRVREPRPEECP